MPGPQTQKASSGFWDRVARRYANMAMRNPAAYQATLDRVRAYLKPDDRVLELGCGTGTTALNLADAVERYIATDYSAEMIAIAGEKRAASTAENLEFCKGAPGEAQMPDGPFDVILGFNFLHLLPDREAVFADVARKLEPGGLFISKTPCLGGVYRFLQPLVVVLHIVGKAPGLSFVTPARLEREIRAAGFDIIETGTYPKRPPSHFIVAKKI